MGSLSLHQRIWVFSDLHLVDPSSSLYQGFLKALEEPNSTNDTVVFAGDIFEIFVGKSRYFTQKHQLFIERLRELSRLNVSLYYIQGNHDFHLNDAFQGVNIHILDSELILDRIYIAHGDLVDQTDQGYLKMRKLFRSAGFQRFVDFLPGFAVEKIGEAIARTHEQKEQDLSRSGAPAPEVRKIYREFAESKKRQGFDHIVLGHCHDLDEMEPFYFNMGYPPVHRQFLYYQWEDKSFKRRIFPGN